MENKLIISSHYHTVIPGVEQLLKDPAQATTLRTQASFDIMIGKYLMVTSHLTGSTGV